MEIRFSVSIIDGVRLLNALERAYENAQSGSAEAEHDEELLRFVHTMTEKSLKEVEQRDHKARMTGISAPWVLNELSGMKFPRSDGAQPYDLMKRRIEEELASRSDEAESESIPHLRRCIKCHSGWRDGSLIENPREPKACATCGWQLQVRDAE